MKRKGPLSRLVLPSVVSPTTSTCFQVPVPNDPQHIAAFKGAIYRLAKAYTWADDDAHTAKDVAAVWSDIFDNLAECDVTTPLQFRQVSDCYLEMSSDGGETWVPIFNAYNCAAGAARDVIAQKISDGSLSGGSQPGGIGGGTALECYEYDVNLFGNNRWISPVKITGDDTVEITNVKGAWYDGVVSGIWKCADGHTYALGGCLGGGQGHETGDPDSVNYHMRLIAQYGTTPTFVDGYNTSFSVPHGTPDSDLLFQANDGLLDDNQGSVSFHVKICKQPPTNVYVEIRWSSDASFSAVYGIHYIIHSQAISGTNRVAFWTYDDYTLAVVQCAAYYASLHDGPYGGPTAAYAGCDEVQHFMGVTSLPDPSASRVKMTYFMWENALNAFSVDLAFYAEYV